MPKITQDEVTSYLNWSIKLNSTIQVQKTQVKQASIVIKDNMIDMASLNQVDRSIMLNKYHVEIIDFDVKSKLII